MPKRSKEAPREKAARAARYELEAWRANIARKYDTLAEARKAAKRGGGRIRSALTGKFVPTEPGAPKPAPRPAARQRVPRHRNKTATDALGGKVGAATTILTPGATCLQRERARYRLVELANLKPSHSGETFRATPGYPSGVQERRYDTDKAEQAKVIGNAQSSCFEPALIVSTSAGALGGPPIVTSSGVVLGGNSRTMVLQRVVARGGPAWSEYKREIERTAPDFGLDAGDVRQLRSPVLVRVVDLPRERWKDAVRRYNEALTQELGTTARQVAIAARISDAIVAELDAIPDDQTLYEWLRSPASRGLVGVRVMKVKESTS